MIKTLLLEVVGPAIILIAVVLIGVYLVVGEPNFNAELVCAQKGGHLVRTYSDKVCAKLEVIK